MNLNDADLICEAIGNGCSSCKQRHKVCSQAQGTEKHKHDSEIRNLFVKMNPAYIPIVGAGS